ncbi:OmpH family outer membrane protein [Pokkaliibacter sp. MBI-7]|uniref:OmpH family outer membrane protein n=1 Tax=Pokkaliibacter sp. MBI-7 TaxID=3040600 RepID=UPI00244B88FF|nr:OmpH family outer membrane protein [Pokkaliibacter sp. MBI-7]MDH2434565.1 OmpH family outer membrane protein [Pokkaliibacter sp. MBI-7]
MMKTWASAMLVGMGLSLASVAHAIDVVVLDVPQALFSSERAKTFMKGLDKEFSDSEGRLERLARDIQSGQQQLQKDGSVMKDTDRRKTEQSLQDKVSEYRFLQQKVQSGRADRQQEFLDNNRALLDKLIRQMIDQKNIKVILNKQGTVYVAPDADMTKTLVDLLNKSK